MELLIRRNISKKRGFPSYPYLIAEGNVLFCFLDAIWNMDRATGPCRAKGPRKNVKSVRLPRSKCEVKCKPKLSGFEAFRNTLFAQPLTVDMSFLLSCPVLPSLQKPRNPHLSNAENQSFPVVWGQQCTDPWQKRTPLEG
jgi:hypothetical protein